MKITHLELLRFLRSDTFGNFVREHQAEETESMDPGPLLQLNRAMHIEVSQSTEQR